jgi:uncharacterized protein
VSGQLLPRYSLDLVKRALVNFRVVIINGPRQCGKSTLVELLHREVGGSRFTLDDRDILRAARTDPGGLAEAGPYPMMIDEVQRGGEPLILAIKSDVDRHGFENGRFVLAGSSRFLTVPGITESLAGRARIIDLWPLSQAESSGKVPSFIDDAFSGPATLAHATPTSESRHLVFERMIAGGFPAAMRMQSSRDRLDWFGDYLATLLQRDLGQIRTPRRVVDLPKLLRLIALRTGEEVVGATIASDLGLTADTVKDYLGLFESIYVHHTIPAWTPGGTGRVVHRPKLHVVDSGVACHLRGVGVDELARPGNTTVGHLLESFVVGELQRHVPWSELRPTMHHYRDKAKREIDVVLEARDGRVVGIEVKAANDVDDTDFRHLRYLRDQLGERFVTGIVLHLGERVAPQGDRLISMPITALW